MLRSRGRRHRHRGGSMRLLFFHFGHGWLGSPIRTRIARRLNLA
jgi:hypothetical protein